jgi:hypothetical protein
MCRNEKGSSKVETEERRIDPTELKTFAKLYGKAAGSGRGA